MQRLVILLLSILGCVSITAPLYAEVETADKIVVVKGMGISPDKAKENAIRNAVEQAVGSYITSATMVKNNQLLNDEIFSYSHGYVKEIDIISQEKTSDGFFSVQIKALIINHKIHEKLHELNESISKASGESLFAEAFSKMNEQKSGIDLLSYNLSKYPKQAYTLSVGEISIADTDYNTGRASIAIPVTFRWDKAFLNELQTTLSHILNNERKMIDATWLYQNILNHYRGGRVMCFTNKDTLDHSRIESCFVLDESLMKRLRQVPGTNLMERRTIPLLISFKNKDGEAIGSMTYNLAEWDSSTKQGITFNKQDAGVKEFLKSIFTKTPPSFGFDIVHFFTNPRHLPNTLSIRTECTILISDGSYATAAKVDVDLNTLNNIATVDVQFI